MARKCSFIILVTLCLANVCYGQSDKHKPELFTSYLSGTTLPAQADIPAPTCQAIIKQADRIVTADELKTVPGRELHVASLNLRTCATSKLARFDRDMAVGIYGEVVSELERRERAGK